MFSLKFLTICLVLAGSFAGFLNAQVPVEQLGLANRNITCLGMYNNIIAVGTLGHGVFYQDSLIGTNWIHLGLDSAEVHSVYPHKSGPLGWAIGAGLKPDSSYPHFVYCSFVGGPFEPKDSGISDSLAILIEQLDGFPDPSICGETYAAAGGALYRRYFTDTVWTPVYTATVEGYVQTVKVHEDFPGLVLAGGAEGFAGTLLIKSYDYGNTWEWISPPDFVRDVDFWGDSAQTIFSVGYPVVRRSLDGGSTWTEVYSGPFIINKVLYDPVLSLVFLAGQDLFVSGDPVLLYSADLGDTWLSINLPVTDNAIVDLEKGADGWIYFAMPDSGVFRLNPIYVGWKDEPQSAEIGEYQLYQNYSNPFNGETIIQYQLPEKTNLEITVLNLLGQKVRTLFSGEQTSGLHRVRWDGKDKHGQVVAGGIYIYRLKSSKFSDSGKMLYLK
jgi:hypothetical protein